jgi:hypothetical protein
VAEVAKGEEAEEREADEEREDPEQERGISDVGAVVPNALRLPETSLSARSQVQAER